MEWSLEKSRPFQGRPIWMSSMGVSQSEERGSDGFQCKFNGFHGSSDVSLFSRSLPITFHDKLNVADEEHGGQSVKKASYSKRLQGEELLQSLENIEPHTIGTVLPDDEEELLAGIMDDLDLNGLSSQAEESEEYDLFSSGGGIELDSDSQVPNAHIAKARILDNTGVGMVHHSISNGSGTIAGEHPYGEHPSRTLFVRNINSNVEDFELRGLFEQHGDIRTLYTACKHRGFVMISYYDIRAARSAMRALQNKPLRRRKLDIHFSIPKDNPSDKDVNQGTLVVFNLDPSVTNDDLRVIFGAYGEVKEIRETPHKRHHKFIEFYDVRAADAALRALNRSDIAGKRIKLEPSRPGGTRRSVLPMLGNCSTLTKQLGMDLERDEISNYRQQVGFSPINSPSGPWAHFSYPSDTGSLRSMEHSPGNGANKPVPALARSIPPVVPPLSKFGSTSNGMRQPSYTDPVSFINSMEKIGHLHDSHSLPEQNTRIMQLMHYNRGTVPVLRSSTPIGRREEMDISSNSAYDQANANSGGSCDLAGSQHLWGSPSRYTHHIQNPGWRTPCLGHSFDLSSYAYPHGYLYSGGQGSNGNSAPIPLHNYHAGSAPSGNRSIESQLGYLTESPTSSFVYPRACGAMSLSSTGESHLINSGMHGVLNGCSALATHVNLESGSRSFGAMSSQSRVNMFAECGFLGSISSNGEDLNEQGRSGSGGNYVNQAENKKQYQLDVDKISRGEDTRTTLMIKNIPNKYTSKMLLAAIDEQHGGTYDFLYLPIDFKNKCNVGYAFINMTSPSHIIHFYQGFNGKKWEKFNSEKVASLAYARIQGKAALVAHFQNSSLMNEDKRCRPILFYSEDQEASDQEAFPSGINTRFQPSKYSGGSDLLESPTQNGTKGDTVIGNVEATLGNTHSSVK